jgi:hypothetical protein
LHEHAHVASAASLAGYIQSGPKRPVDQADLGGDKTGFIRVAIHVAILMEPAGIEFAAWGRLKRQAVAADNEFYGTSAANRRAAGDLDDVAGGGLAGHFER